MLTLKTNAMKYKDSDDGTMKDIGMIVGNKQGSDGFSPIATVTQTNEGAIIEIQDKNGSTTTTVYNGKDGVNGVDGKDGYTPQKGVDYFDGQDGAKGDKGDTGEKGEQGEKGLDGANGSDGVSPIVSVTTIEGGHRITITDANGEKSIDVMDGVDGASGSDGKDGTNGINGIDGEDGVGIQSVVQTTTSDADSGENIVTVTLTNGQTATFTVKNGSKGNTGEQGIQGENGIDGKSAYEYAQEGGYVGTEEEFKLKMVQEIPTLLSQLTNDTGFITKSVSDLASYYLKSETYTRNEINERISTIPKFSIKAVDILPTTNISTTTVYLLKSTDTTNLYTEYIYENGAWVILGTQTVDLINYVQNTDAVIYNSLSMNRTQDSVIGSYSTALGLNNIASGSYSYANGTDNEASGVRSHVEGYMNKATAHAAHVEGQQNFVTGNSSHAENALNENYGNYSHVEGYNNKILDGGNVSHIEGSKNTINNSVRTHVEGQRNGVVNGVDNHLEGCHNTIWGGASYSHIEGFGNKTKSSYQHVHGKNNIEDRENLYAHIIGNGTSTTNEDLEIISQNPSNAHTIDWSGNAWYQGSVTSNGADYAEYFEWLDGNPDNEDRVGLLVTLDGEKIRLANNGDEILGIISGTAAVLGDNYECEWNGKYLTDDFGRVIYDMVEEFSDEVVGEDEEGNPIIEKQSLGFFKHPRINPDYDPKQAYVNRSDRPEWDTVGMLGKLYVRDDGTCQVNGYATVGENGIATKSDEKTNMRVLSRVNENVIRVLLK